MKEGDIELLDSELVELLEYRRDRVKEVIDDLQARAETLKKALKSMDQSIQMYSRIYLAVMEKLTEEQKALEDGLQ